MATALALLAGVLLPCGGFFPPHKPRPRLKVSGPEGGAGRGPGRAGGAVAGGGTPRKGLVPGWGLGALATDKARFPSLVAPERKGRACGQRTPPPPAPRALSGGLGPGSRPCLTDLLYCLPLNPHFWAQWRFLPFPAFSLPYRLPALLLGL